MIYGNVSWHNIAYQEKSNSMNFQHLFFAAPRCATTPAPQVASGL